MQHRLARVGELLKRELSSAVLREVSPDLRNATVHVGILGSAGEQKQALQRLEQHRVPLQAECAKRVVLKFTPHLHFRLDESIVRGMRILDILEEIGTNEEDAEP